MTGVVAERYLLRTSVLAEASPDDIVNLLRPCFQMLAGLSTESGGPVDSPPGQRGPDRWTAGAGARHPECS
ncbi:hypothetical protein MXD63_24400 [Frankia sp. Cpl3]|nr:hypothetical protein [Frankia sp. Cpl3]